MDDIASYCLRAANWLNFPGATKTWDPTVSPVVADFVRAIWQTTGEHKAAIIGPVLVETRGTASRFGCDKERFYLILRWKLDALRRLCDLMKKPVPEQYFSLETIRATFATFEQDGTFDMQLSCELGTILGLLDGAPLSGTALLLGPLVHPLETGLFGPHSEAARQIEANIHETLLAAAAACIRQVTRSKSITHSSLEIGTTITNIWLSAQNVLREISRIDSGSVFSDEALYVL